MNSSAFVNVLRLLVGFFFMLSGLVKAIDPVGTAYKVADYLVAWGLTDAAAGDLPMAASVGVIVSEFMLGIYLIVGIRRKFTLYMSTIYMGLMLLLSLYVMIANPVSDCGCFGDAIKLSNVATFVKNVPLMLAVVWMWYHRSKIFAFVSERSMWIVSIYSLVFIGLVCFNAVRSLPYIDFRPYRIGVNIKQAMEIPANAKAPVFESTFVYEKGGERRTFGVDNLPDSTWSFVDSKSVLVSEGFTPAITNFTITNRYGDDITEEMLSDTAYAFWLVAPYLDKADDGSVDRINTFYDFAADNHLPFYCLTSSTRDAIERWIDKSGAAYQFVFADEVTLKTMIRSNPGLMLMKGGTIINKWSNDKLPDTDRPETILTPVEETSMTSKWLRLIMMYLLPLLAVILIDKVIVWSRLHKVYQFRKLKHTNNMRKKIVAGNWKMNLNLQEGVALAEELKKALETNKPNCDVVICTPFIHLAKVADVVEGTVIGLGAENCADKEKGAYTGEVSAAQVKSTGAQYVILGHSERRSYYGETAAILKEKTKLALANSLKVIFCIGEVLEEREAGKQNEVVKAQLEGSLFDFTTEELSNIILAYEPVWAIGTGKTATAEQAEEMHAFIRSTIAAKFGNETAENISILYGGSAKPDNAKDLFSKPNVDGGLIGGAALKAADFVGIIDAWK